MTTSTLEATAATETVSVEIRNRYTGDVQATVNITCSPDASASVRLGLAVREALFTGADLTGANLTRTNFYGANLTGAELNMANLTGAELFGANLTGAELTRAELTRADLTRAKLTRAELTGANLTGANLTGAELFGANLTRANLIGANLTGAKLTGAELTDANLTDANLTGANLIGAELFGAELTGAKLTDANLTGAELTRVKLTAIQADYILVLSRAIREIPALMMALTEGRVDGSQYEGRCACLVGTIANARECDYSGLSGITPDSSRPSERFFLAIKTGDTPANNPVSAIVLEWTQEFWRSFRAAAITEFKLTDDAVPVVTGDEVVTTESAS